MQALVASLVLALGHWGQGHEALPRRPFFGASLAAADKGVKIVQVTPDTTAESAGLKTDDVVTAIGDSATATAADLGKVVSGLKTGVHVKIAFLRGGQGQSADATVKPRPADKGAGYETVYDDVVSKGSRIRLLVTRPTSPGKHPALFFIQGIGYYSYEMPLASDHPYARVLKAFSDKGYVTVRVEKPGLGESEGGPADKVDFDTELDAFRQALLKTKSYEFVDADRVFIFGHSMGGCEGPILASEIPVRGLAVYGTVARTWMEYVVEMFRNQYSLSGASASALDATERNTIAALHLLFNEGLSPDEVKAKYPKWAPAVQGLFPDGQHFSGVGLPFWRGCFAQNFASYWEKLDTNVLSIYGACDFVADREDHPLIAEIVNKAHPGKAKFVEIPNSDHAFRNVASQRESQEFWSKGGKAMNPAICDVLVSWAEGLR